MITVFELGYRYVIPSIRRRLVELLVEKHSLEEVEVAKLLSVSTSAASRNISA